mmetsp:Transcript_22481/g.49978  ORF Transcript_22481/g.49978 Transcript_22481/m.49978 type:complete len:264 (-) Transcript_22481:176-967(-)
MMMTIIILPPTTLTTRLLAREAHQTSRTPTATAAGGTKGTTCRDVPNTATSTRARWEPPGKIAATAGWTPRPQPLPSQRVRLSRRIQPHPLLSPRVRLSRPRPPMTMIPSIGTPPMTMIPSVGTPSAGPPRHLLAKGTPQDGLTLSATAAGIMRCSTPPDARKKATSTSAQWDLPGYIAATAGWTPQPQPLPSQRVRLSRRIQPHPLLSPRVRLSRPRPPMIPQWMTTSCSGTLNLWGPQSLLAREALQTLRMSSVLIVPSMK